MSIKRKLQNLKNEAMTDEELANSNGGGFYKWTLGDSPAKHLDKRYYETCPKCGAARGAGWTLNNWQYTTIFRRITKPKWYCNVCGYNKEAACKAPTSSAWL